MLNVFQFTNGGQRVWFHKDSSLNGNLHTYDNFKLEGNHHHSYISQTHKIHIFLPRDYEKSEAKYQVVYIIADNGSIWKDGISAKSFKTISNLSSQRKIMNVIVVSICSEDNEKDYKQKKCEDLENYAFCVTKIKEWIDLHYRTIPNPNQTAICGAEDGGFTAFYTGCIFSHCFGIVIAMSPSFCTEEDKIKKNSFIKHLQTKLKSSPHSQIWISWKEGEKKAANDFIHFLQTNFDFKIDKDLFVFHDVQNIEQDFWDYFFKIAIEKFFSNQNNLAYSNENRK